MTKKQTLTPAMIDSLVKGAISVPECAGLTIEATATGKKVWRYKRRVSGTGEIVKMTLGNFPAFTIPMARAWANDLNLQVERGENPKAKAEQEAAVAAMTVDRAHELYMVACQRPDRKRTLKASSLDNKRQYYRLIQPTVGHLPINEVTDDTLWEIVERKALSHPPTANRMASEAKTFFAWCASRQGKLAGVGLRVDPALTLNAGEYREARRERFLSDEELRLFFLALADSKALVAHYPAGNTRSRREAEALRESIEKAEDRAKVYRRAILLMLLTGCRKTEVLGAHSSEYVEGVWTIPAERTKNGRAHAIPLSPWGCALIDSGNDFVIPSNRLEGSMEGGWYKVRDRIIEKMVRLNDGVAIEPFTFHDLRRTLRSNTKRLKIDSDTSEAMINHAKSGLIAVYDRYDMLSEKREGVDRRGKRTPVAG